MSARRAGGAGSFRLRRAGARQGPSTVPVATPLVIVVGYLLGSMPWGLWLPRWFAGVDVRLMGSGNIGAANVGRQLGLSWGLTVAFLDIAKGALPALLGLVLIDDTGAVLAGTAAMLGHYRPVFLRFARGGKAAATALGVSLAVAPLASLCVAALWIALFLATRYSSVASLAASIAMPPLALALGASLPVLAFLAGAAAAIVVFHRANIVRLLRGTENRFTFSRRLRLRRVPPTL